MGTRLHKKISHLRKPRHQTDCKNIYPFYIKAIARLPVYSVINNDTIVLWHNQLKKWTSAYDVEPYWYYNLVLYKYPPQSFLHIIFFLYQIMLNRWCYWTKTGNVEFVRAITTYISKIIYKLRIHTLVVKHGQIGDSTNLSILIRW